MKSTDELLKQIRELTLMNLEKKKVLTRSESVNISVSFLIHIICSRKISLSI